MAAFTTFSEESLQGYLNQFNFGAGIDQLQFSAISEGIENSNYFVSFVADSHEHHYVLTLLEEIPLSDMAFFVPLLQQLQDAGLPVAAPLTAQESPSATTFCEKPATLVPRLSGAHPSAPSSQQCSAIGEFIAASHQALVDATLSRPNPYSVTWMKGALKSAARLTAADEKLLGDIIEQYQQMERIGLPTGIIHGDLFRDNALFVDEQLCGVIDYYHACNDYLIMDLAVAINDWCCTSDDQIDPARRDAMLAAYQRQRPLTKEELQHLPAMQAISAARFCLTRFKSGDPPLKDPGQMLKLARHLS